MGLPHGYTKLLIPLMQSRLLLQFGVLPLLAAWSLQPAVAQQYLITTVAGEIAQPEATAGSNSPIGTPTGLAADTYGNSFYIATMRFSKSTVSGSSPALRGLRGRSGIPETGVRRRQPC